MISRAVTSQPCGKWATMATAALIDDHPIFRDVVKLLFEQRGGPEVIAEASEPGEALDLVSATRPDVVLLDMVFSTDTGGVELAKQLLARNPAQRILFVSMVKDAAKVADAIRTGALGYVTKDQTPAELFRAVTEVLAGHPYFTARMGTDRGTPHRPDVLATLTARERQVFDLVVAGLSSRSIAQRLTISPRTVETHRSRVMAKLAVHTAADLVRFAARLGLLN
jgi:DNA-binding NarL/FixJ family response regulator